MKQWSLLLASVLALCGCTISFNPGQDREAPVDTGTAAQQASVLAAARRVADCFDRDRFDEAWALTGPMLRASTNQALLSSTVRLLRKPLGAPGHRKVKGFNFLKAIDGVEGDFGLIAIETDFEKANDVEEKFVFQKIGDEWKLAGYWLSRKVTLDGEGG